MFIKKHRSSAMNAILLLGRSCKDRSSVNRSLGTMSL